MADVTEVDLESDGLAEVVFEAGADIGLVILLIESPLGGPVAAICVMLLCTK